MALEPFTRRVLADKYGYSFARAMQDMIDIVNAIRGSWVPMRRPRTCRLCGARPGHHEGCPLMPRPAA